jgi:hypothetical protein
VSLGRCEMSRHKGTQASLIVIAGLLSCSYASATVIFHNTGTTSGWSQVLTEHYGTVTQVSSPVFKGSTAIKATQIYDASYTGRFHSEVIKNGVYKPGDQGFYGFAFYLPSNWQFVSQGYNISQFEADFTDTGCDGWMPTTMMWLTNSSLSTRVKSGTACAQSISTISAFASVTAGAWHRVEMQAYWKSDSSGFFRVWYDGAKKVERLGVPTTIADSKSRAYGYRVGIYANGWHDQGKMVGSQGTRTIYFDQIGAGTTFAEADPNGW